VQCPISGHCLSAVELRLCCGCARRSFGLPLATRSSGPLLFLACCCCCWPTGETWKFSNFAQMWPEKVALQIRISRLCRWPMLANAALATIGLHYGALGPIGHCKRTRNRTPQKEALFPLLQLDKYLHSLPFSSVYFPLENSSPFRLCLFFPSLCTGHWAARHFRSRLPAAKGWLASAQVFCAYSVHILRLFGQNLRPKCWLENAQSPKFLPNSLFPNKSRPTKSRPTTKVIKS